MSMGKAMGLQLVRGQVIVYRRVVEVVAMVDGVVVGLMVGHPTVR